MKAQQNNEYIAEAERFVADITAEVFPRYNPEAKFQAVVSDENKALRTDEQRVYTISYTEDHRRPGTTPIALVTAQFKPAGWRASVREYSPKIIPAVYRMIMEQEYAGVKNIFVSGPHVREQIN